MNCRQWFLGTLALFVCFISVVFVLVNFCVDPRGEYRWIETSWNKNKYVGGSLWQLVKKLDENPYTLFFGSSRVHVFSSKIMGEPVLNFSSLYRNPADIYAFLSSLNENELKNIKQVYVLLDLDGLFYEHRLKTFENRRDLFFDELINLNFLKLKEAYECVYNNLIDSKENIVDKDGNVLVKANTYLGSIHALNLDKKYISDYCLDYLQKIATFCKFHGVQLTFFTYTSPENVTPYRPFINIMLNQLLQKLDGFHNLLDLPSLKNRYDLFTDETHLTTQGAEIVAAYLKDPAKPYFVSKQNTPYGFHPDKVYDLSEIKQKPLHLLSELEKLLLLETLAFERHTNPEQKAKRILETVSTRYTGAIIFELNKASRQSWLKYLLNRSGVHNYNIEFPAGVAYAGSSSILNALAEMKLHQLRPIFIYLKHQSFISDEIKTGAPLYSALLANNYNYAEVLLNNGASPNDKDKSGLTIFTYAIAEQNKDMIDLFFAHNADINADIYHGQTILHYFIASGNVEAAKLTIYLQADVNRRDQDGRTPLHFALYNGNLSLAWFLLQNRASPWIKDINGITPYALAQGLHASQLLAFMNTVTEQ